MDKFRAKRIAEELKGKCVGGWKIIEYVNNGKSAVILKATRNEETAALKIFDPDLVELFKRENQMIRVNRERKLINEKHPNLIEVKDGGECEETGYIFVAMAYLSRKNLAEVIIDLPRDCIFPLISQVASAAKFLEDKGLAHRDIKPENIAISDNFKQAILLDLGVLRPVGFPEITDDSEQLVFVGTLRYSPPELLYRKEQDTPEGWRAITFYQLGAVLHDMIMRRTIFHEFSQPYATLVDAVRSITPEINANDVNSDLILLAKNCLVKEPEIRLSIVSWENFLEPQAKVSPIDSIRERIRKRKANSGIKQGKIILATDKDYENKRFLEETIELIKGGIRETCLNDRDSFPRYQINQQFEEGDTEALIFVCFRPSHTYRLCITVTLLLLISLLDEPDRILDLRFEAFAQGCVIIFLNSHP